MRNKCGKHDGDDSEELVELLTKVLTTFHKETIKEILKMSATLQDLKDAITALVAKAAELKASVDLEIAQGVELTTAIEALLAKIGSNPDFAEEVAAVSAVLTDIDATKAKLESDNAGLQEEIEKAKTA
jgi:hypothetical protein